MQRPKLNTRIVIAPIGQEEMRMKLFFLYGDVPQNFRCAGSLPLAFRSQGTRTYYKIHFYAFLNTRKCSHNLLLSLHRELRVDSEFPGTGNPHEAPCSGLPRTRNLHGFSVPGNPVPTWFPASLKRNPKLASIP